MIITIHKLFLTHAHSYRQIHYRHYTHIMNIHMHTYVWTYTYIVTLHTDRHMEYTVDNQPNLAKGFIPKFVSKNKFGSVLSTSKILTYSYMTLDTENFHCDNCNKRQCDYCGDIAVEYFPGSSNISTIGENCTSI